MTDEKLSSLAPHLVVEVSSLADDPNMVKCPRCWHYSSEGKHNYDGLCDRCCLVIVDSFKDHESYPHIVESRSLQIGKFGIKLPNDDKG